MDVHTVTLYHIFSMMTYPYDILLSELSRMSMSQSLGLFLHSLYFHLSSWGNKVFDLFFGLVLSHALQGVCKAFTCMMIVMDFVSQVARDNSNKKLSLRSTLRSFIVSSNLSLCWIFFHASCCFYLCYMYFWYVSSNHVQHRMFSVWDKVIELCIKLLQYACNAL